MPIFMCPNCETICVLFDDLLTKQIFHHCETCNEKFPSGSVLWSKTFVERQSTSLAKSIIQDPTLPVDNIHQCEKCGKNDNVCIRNTDLTIRYLCKHCC